MARYCRSFANSTVQGLLGERNVHNNQGGYKTFSIKFKFRGLSISVIILKTIIHLNY